MIYIFSGLPLSSQYKQRGIEATQPDSKGVPVSLIQVLQVSVKQLWLRGVPDLIVQSGR